MFPLLHPFHRHCYLFSTMISDISQIMRFCESFYQTEEKTTYRRILCDCNVIIWIRFDWHRILLVYWYLWYLIQQIACCAFIFKGKTFRRWKNTNSTAHTLSIYASQIMDYRWMDDLKYVRLNSNYKLLNRMKNTDWTIKSFNFKWIHLKSWQRAITQ